MLQNHGFDDDKINAMLYIIEYYQSNYLNFTPINENTQSSHSVNNQGYSDSGIMSPQSNMKYEIYKKSLHSTDVHSLLKSIHPDVIDNNNQSNEVIDKEKHMGNNHTSTIDDYLMKIDETQNLKILEAEAEVEAEAEPETKAAKASNVENHEQQKTQVQQPETNGVANNSTSSSHVNNEAAVLEHKTETVDTETQSQIKKPLDSDTVSHESIMAKEKPQKVTKKSGSTPKVKKMEDLEGKISDLIKVSTELTQKVKDLEMENNLLKKMVTEKGQFSSVKEVEKLYNSNK